ncbi:MarR family transcriptional regulator [Kribbella sandramycini]|uniref:MarR family transcriptional regulator n=1 Tax=Kribbella sandramycini TaxID=60450 RepID=A0A7Y4L7H2_9ACTN|nr:MarR family transcriptional regulator [Kribbella sandramycini]MBB6567069.1 DNA-binding MarR family transcriptional regulator [Kribbella sandramycini]NOL44787.1 MarR family transcriptional regulator [Kribbella sandramycini]
MTSRKPGSVEVTRLIQLLVAEGQRIAHRFAQRHDAHPTDMEALIRILQSGADGAPMTAGELGRELGLTSGTVTALVDRLERAGHVRRERDPVDRRKVLIHYGDTGMQLARQFFVPLGDLHRQATAEFSPAEVEVVRRYLAATLDSYQAYRRRLEDDE